MNKKKSNKESDFKYSDGKHHTKKSKGTSEKKSRNNIKQDLKKEYL